MSLTDVAPNTDDGLIDRLRTATLGRYDIYAELGRGGMAAVFLALDVALGRKVAIKAMLPEIAVDVGAVERFRREARFAASLSHPSIVSIYTVGESLSPPYFVMKFVDGRALDSVLRSEGAQSAALVQAVLQQVGSALEYAHRRDITHRDVKPANIMLDDDGWILLTDFGIAKTSDALALTSSGMIVGTPAYMSPEHFSGGAVGPAADQYALGCVGYELLTGKRPFERRTIGEVMKAHLLDEAPALVDIDPDCPPRLADVIHRMIAKEPADRFPSVAAAMHALGVAEPEQQRLVTTHIVKLAKTGEDHRPRISQPISPVPPSALRRKPTNEQGVRAVASTESSAPSTTKRWRPAWIATPLISMMALVVWYATQGSPKEPRVASAEPDTASPVPRMTGTPAAGAVDSSRASAPTKPKLPDVTQPRKPEGNKGLPRAEESGGRGTQPTTTPPRDSVVPVTPPDAPVFTDTTPRPSVSNVVDSASITIGSRTPYAYLYIDGVMHSALYGKRLVVIRLAPGRHRIVVTVQDCPTPFDTLVTLASGEKLNLNYKNPTCDSP